MTTDGKTGARGRSGFRWTICGLLFAATTINYMDRQVLGILAPTLQRELGWDELEYSHIVMAFQAAYAIGLLGFGRLVDVIGTRHGYAISIFAWSLAAMAHALARRVTAAELAHINSDPPEPVAEKIPWSELLRHRQTWAFVVAISLTAPIWWRLPSPMH